MNKMIPFCILCLFLVCTGCGPNYIFDQTFEIENQEWTYENQLDFKVDIKDTLRIYNLYLDIEHASDYPHQNIYILINTLFPSGQKTQEKVPINFADKGGQWYGDCGNEWCSLRINIQQGAFFNALGTHTFSIEQYMRLNPLPGIKTVSLKIEETEQSRQ